MIHYSCDRCKRMMDPDEDQRYVVRIEVHAAMEPLDLDELEDDRDHLMEIQEILERLEDDECDPVGDEAYQNRHYDLCPECYRDYIKNPLGRDLPVQIGFSDN
ncbi:MAG: hypothetical protein R3C99_08290 [Pirellulaceae bacterium]|nr:hypothetical protein [Planctomycetales bacterium]MCA9161427.1 hypothetical protein [Planctomycetales bacterium]MCA9203872.1 hypothetical protein [Planctomycetales bacterium]MCA9207827.1 hypothetical protein [Planctomycetales bacterium]MCA9224142.1 hypothetical protein [Planctomycetales bacterium]